jgi:hypothetical protein
VSSEQATGDVFKNQLDDLALNERDTPYLSDRSAVETDDISDSFFDDKPVRKPVTSFADLSSDTESSGGTTVTDEKTDKIDDSFFDVAALRDPWLKLSGQEIEAGAAGERVIERRRGRIQKKRGRTQKRRRGPAKRRIDRLARPNFSLQKLSQNRYVLHAINVTKGVVSQVRSLLLKVPGMSLTVNGRMIAKKDALREIIRELIQKSRVEIVL